MYIYIYCIIITIRVSTHITLTRHIRSDVHRTHAYEFLHGRHARPPHVLDTLLYKAADSHMLGTSILYKYT